MPTTTVALRAGWGWPVSIPKKPGVPLYPSARTETWWGVPRVRERDGTQRHPLARLAEEVKRSWLPRRIYKSHHSHPPLSAIFRRAKAKGQSSRLRRTASAPSDSTEHHQDDRTNPDSGVGGRATGMVGEQDQSGVGVWGRGAHLGQRPRCWLPRLDTRLEIGIRLDRCLVHGYIDTPSGSNCWGSVSINLWSIFLFSPAVSIHCDGPGVSLQIGPIASYTTGQGFGPEDPTIWYVLH